LQANVLSVGQIDKQTREQMIESGYGGGIVGGALGAGTGVLVSGHPDAVVGGALAGAALGMLIDASIKDVTYAITTDVQISERTKNTVHTRRESTLAQGSSSNIQVKSSGTDHWNRYQTRVISTANKANLKLDQALPDLTEGMSRSIAGIF
jgi:outer membrane lipoprotein SlyB